MLPRGSRLDFMMLSVSIYGAGQLGNGVAAALRAGGRCTVLGPFGRSDRQKALASGADVVLIATTTRLRDVAPDIELAVRAASDVLVSAEECAYPFVVDDALARRLDGLAVEHGVSVAGCGVNPGLIFDALVLTLLGATSGDCRIQAWRTVDISQFGETVLRRIGIGRSTDAFRDAVARDEILGHAGFPQSICVVADAMGLIVERIDKELQPITSESALELPGRFSIRPGESAGVNQTYTAYSDGRRWYTCHFLGHVDLKRLGKSPGDEVELWRGGVLVQSLQIRPGIAPQLGSQSMVTNSVERIVNARPGWRTVAELTPAHPYLGVRAMGSSLAADRRTLGSEL
jgi:2,4-diaminopentanoate dehydrogenase